MRNSIAGTIKSGSLGIMTGGEVCWSCKGLLVQAHNMYWIAVMIDRKEGVGNDFSKK